MYASTPSSHEAGTCSPAGGPHPLDVYAPAPGVKRPPQYAARILQEVRRGRPVTHDMMGGSAEDPQPELLSKDPGQAPENRNLQTPSPDPSQGRIQQREAVH